MQFRGIIIFLTALLVFGFGQITIAQSDDFELKIPELFAPAPGGRVGSTTPRLQWEPVCYSDLNQLGIDENQCWYHLEIIDEAQNVVVSIDTKDTRYDIPLYDTPYTKKLEPSETYQWRVQSFCVHGSGEKKSNASERRSFIAGGYPWACDKGNDQDCDGIPDEVEKQIGTSKEKKTLFVRPRIKVSANETGKYWNDFIETYFPQPDGSCKNRCIASIPPFEAANIEVVIIGCKLPRPYTCPSQSYLKLWENFKDFDFNPSLVDPDFSSLPDLKLLPCSIMEIIFNQSEPYCAYGDDRSYAGHTHLSVSKTKIRIPSRVEPEIEEEKYKEVDTYTWTWTTLGYTPSNRKTHGYYIPSIYLIPTENYFNERAYPEIRKNETPATTACNNMTQNECGNCVGDETLDCYSPINPEGGNTVEFAPIIISNNAGRIDDIYPTTTPKYDQKDVVRRMIVHEMGHAILSATGLDHCPNPNCIMYQSIKNWSLTGFGTRCNHFEIIQADGIILNLPHEE